MPVNIKRADGRRINEIRPVRITRRYTKNAPGSVLIEVGDTKVICTATVERRVPHFLQNSGTGWVTAEYGMLPGSTGQRKPRDGRGRVDGRAMEIQRLIGRSLRAVIDLEKIGERTIWIDCDVIQADGGTRTAAITGGYVAMVDAVRRLRDDELIAENPLTGSVAAVSVGIVEGKTLADLCYTEDSGAEVDMNVVMTGRGEFIEIQGAAEHKTFTVEDLKKLLTVAKSGIKKLIRAQGRALSDK